MDNVYAKLDKDLVAKKIVNAAASASHLSASPSSSSFEDWLNAPVQSLAAPRPAKTPRREFGGLNVD